jgi:hypothetical protein
MNDMRTESDENALSRSVESRSSGEPKSLIGIERSG